MLKNELRQLLKGMLKKNFVLNKMVAALQVWNAMIVSLVLE